MVENHHRSLESSNLLVLGLWVIVGDRAVNEPSFLE